MSLLPRALPCLALALFAFVALVLDLGGGRPELLFTLAPLALLPLLGVEKVPLRAIVALGAILLITEAISTRSPPRWMPYLPVILGLALARLPAKSRPPRAPGSAAIALLTAAALAGFVLLPIWRDPALAAPVAGTAALSAAAAVLAAKTGKGRAAAWAALLACTTPALALWREDSSCRQSVSSGTLEFALKGCPESDPICLEVLKREAGGIAFERPERALLSLCSEFHQWATVDLASAALQAGAASVACGLPISAGEPGVTLVFARGSGRAAMLTPGPEREERLRYPPPSEWGTVAVTLEGGAPLTLDRLRGPVRWRLPHWVPSLVDGDAAPGWWTALAAGPETVFAAALRPRSELRRWGPDGERDASAGWIASLALDPRAGTLYGAAPLRGEILRWNAETLAPLDPLPAERGLTELHVDAERGLLVAAGGRTGTIRALSADGKQLWSATAGPGPLVTAYDAARGLLIGKSRCGIFQKYVGEDR